MNKRIFFSVTLFFIVPSLFANKDSVYSFRFRNDVIITIDYPQNFSANKKTEIILFALPNGNTTAQTMGKQMLAGDDWHYDIQHIAAQTKFVRNKTVNENIIVVYLENNLKSWPQWKKVHENYLAIIPSIVDTIIEIASVKKFSLHLNGHSGGGSFVFGYLQSQNKIPSFIDRISFLDSDYGYDSSFTKKIADWLKAKHNNHLTVFAYNDSVVIYNGKPLVSPTGGTWYRSKLMMKDLSDEFNFKMVRNDSVVQYSHKNQINFFLVDNPQGKIFHTIQVERNGFIHSILIGTKKENEDYTYWGNRAYSNFIQ